MNQRMRTSLFAVSALLLAPGCLLFAAPVALGNSPGAGMTALSGSPALDRALASIEAKEIEADLRYISSDELGGRDTPSEGLKVAARFLAARLERLGFEHGAADGYLYSYPLESRMIDAEKSKLTIRHGTKTQQLAFGQDYYFYARDLRPFEGAGPVVFCGEGKPADLQGLELTGKWALCLEGESSRSTARERARAFEATGVIGVIVTPSEKYSGLPYPERFRQDIQSLHRPMVSYPRGENAPPSANKTIAQVFVAERSRLGLDGGSAPKLGQTLELEISEQRVPAGSNGQIEVENVCGFWPGSDPKLKHEVLIVSAHYDHVGTNAAGEIFNGADDNGSGTTTLLALAGALKAHGPLRRSVLLLWVSGEEKGLFGSKAWTEKPSLPAGFQAVCDINIDMVGRNAADSLLVTPSRDHASYNGLTRLAESFASDEKFKTLGSADDYWERSDHVNFARNLKIPVCFLFSDVHEDYHKPGDDADKIDFDKVRRVARLVLRMLDSLQADELKL